MTNDTQKSSGELLQFLVVHMNPIVSSATLFPWYQVSMWDYRS